MKRFISGFLGVVMCLTLCMTSAFAADTPMEDTGVLIPVFNSVEEYYEYLNSQNDSISPREKEYAIFSGAIVRKDGASDETCLVYVDWSGNSLISGMRYKEITVKSTSFLFPKTYKTFGDGSSYTSHYPVAAIAGTQLIGKVEISTDVDAVRMEAKDFQAYYTVHKEWVESIEFNAKVDIKD